ncbi:cytochrome P450 [Mycobacterium simiae]|uniref:Cytochrome P450 n=1 Tax=Mycobacterium simiae TaxID=1784 RepID=A0A5B1BRB5_MYCSI|nr:cytochrome P450 [Mycobacterium simiae]KAA1250592.1 cytochrome P450 [Mycobacterium simiae]
MGTSLDRRCLDPLSVDLTNPDTFADGFPYDVFEIHRREAPVFWHQPTEHTPDGEGFWSVAGYTETIAVLRDPVTFSSVTGGRRPFGGTILQDVSVAGQVLSMMDGRRHADIRRLVSPGLGPRMIRRIEADLRRRARRLVDEIEPGVAFDFAVDIAPELPTQTICMLLGVPERDRHWLLAEFESGYNFCGSEKAYMSWVFGEIAESRRDSYFQELVARKRAEPADDMLSIVVNAAFDDPSAPALSDTELYLLFHQLFAAATDDPRNAIAGGLLALAQHPDQCQRLRRDPELMPTAIEEIVRWTTPSPSKRRTATRDVTLGEKTIRAGQKVLVWEASANRDAGVFDRADEFDITRRPNPHLSFGQGVHYCLGAAVIRLELRVFFEELLHRFEHIALVGPIEWARSNRRNGPKHLIVELR